MLVSLPEKCGERQRPINACNKARKYIYICIYTIFNRKYTIKIIGNNCNMVHAFSVQKHTGRSGIKWI